MLDRSQFLVYSSNQVENQCSKSVLYLIPDILKNSKTLCKLFKKKGLRMKDSFKSFLEYI